MKHIISSTALVMALSMTPALAAANSFGSQNNAHERCKNDENNRQVLGGLAGAVAGGVLGSQVSGNGARTEGSAIGAVLGGLAGVGIADKTIDCDPVFDTPEHQTPVYQGPAYQTPQYQTSGSTYPAGSYPAASTTYGNSQGQLGARTYASAPSYGSAQTYGGSQPIYEDRVTVSNHPVYSNPSYGAGGVSQGSTYSEGTVSYPPSGNNSQYASQTYRSAPRYVTAPTYITPPSYSTAPTYSTTQGARVYQASTAPVYSQATSQPVVQNTVYQAAPQPTYSQRPIYSANQSNAHRHGRHSCNMTH